MKLSEELSLILEVLKQHNLDAGIDERQVYTLWKQHRGKYLDQYPLAPQWAYQSFPMKLVQADIGEEICAQYDCTVLKTKYVVPPTVRVGGNDTLRISGLTRENNISLIPDSRIQGYKADPYLCTKPYARIANGYIYIINADTLTDLVFTAVWEDVMDWEDIRECGKTPCSDIMEIETYTPTSIVYDIANRIQYTLLQTYMKIREDVSKNEQDEY